MSDSISSPSEATVPVAGSAAPPATIMMQVGLDAISYWLPDRWLRQLRPNVVDQLVESMRTLGQLQPIVLRPPGCGNGFVLVAGRHRLEAAKVLKWESISAVIINGMDKDRAWLAEIDENLIRADLTPAERAIHNDRRKYLYERAHPETKHGGDRKSKSSRQVGDLTRFTKDTALKTGQSERKIQRDVSRAKDVVVLRKVAGTCLDKGTELDALAKLPETEQHKLAERAMAGEKVTAIQYQAQPIDLTSVQNADSKPVTTEDDPTTPAQRWAKRNHTVERFQILINIIFDTCESGVDNSAFITKALPHLSSDRADAAVKQLKDAQALIGKLSNIIRRGRR